MSLGWFLRRFSREENGATAVLFSLALIPVLGATGIAVDYSNFERARQHLQDAVDSAALAAVTVSRGDFSAETTPVIETTAKRQVEYNNHAGNEVVVVTIRPEQRRVTVAAGSVLRTHFAHFVGLPELDVTAEATAELSGETRPVCLLALDPDEKKSIEFTGPSVVKAPECVFYSDSSDDKALVKRGPGTVEVAGLCAVGSFDGDFDPEPKTNCPPLADPFAALPLPPVSGPCDFNDLRIDTAPVALKPGRYCGGIDLRKGADVVMEPGVYIFDGGPLELTAHSRLSGDGVVLAFLGKDATLNVHAHGNIDVKAPTEGRYEGMVMIGDRVAAKGARSFLHGEGDVRIVGTVYLPSQEVLITGSGEINQDSEQFAMVAGNFDFSGASSATINFKADYEKAGFENVMIRAPQTAVLID